MRCKLNTFRKLSMQEILSQRPSITVMECDKTFEAGATYTIGVDKNKYGVRLTINEQPQSPIYFCTDVSEFRKLFTSFVSLITPDIERAGEVSGEPYGRNVIIYVRPEEYEQFYHDAERIFEEYCLDGICFRGIPDLWFDELALIKYIREHLCSHPIMEWWFHPFHSAGWLSPRYTI
jgi:hypothetical protein